MARKPYSLPLLFILFEILRSVCSENDTLNPFSLRFNKSIKLHDSELTTNKRFEDPSEEKIIEKRRLLLKEGDINFPSAVENQFQNNGFSKKRTNFSETENKIQIPENFQDFNWEAGRNRFSIPLESGNSRNLEEIRSTQPFIGQTGSNQAYDWEEKGNILEKSQSLWSEEKNFKHFSNPQWNTGVGWNNNGKTVAIINDDEKNIFSDERNSHDFNPKFSITKLSNSKMGNIKDFINNNERVREIHSGYLGHLNNNYRNKSPQDFWDTNFCKPEKGVIINFNTECPTSRQFSNQLVHKFIFTPKSSISTHPEASSFPVPGTALISAQRMPPLYYL